MAATVETRTVAEIAEMTSGQDLEAEYVEAVAQLTDKPPLHSLHSLAILAGIAVARVKMLEAGR